MFFTLSLHLAKIKLLVPLKSSNHKLYIKVSSELEETKSIKIPEITNSMLTKYNGMIGINQDLEIKMNKNVTRLNIGVYSMRTFFEDVLLFYNDLSLRKVLQT